MVLDVRDTALELAAVDGQGARGAVHDGRLGHASVLDDDVVDGHGAVIVDLGAGAGARIGPAVVQLMGVGELHLSAAHDLVDDHGAFVQ